MTIAVIGSAGRLGSELCEQLGRRAIGLDLPEFDLTRRAAVLRRLAEIRPHVVINAAAYTRVDRAEEEADRCRAVNAEGVAHLAEACGELDCTLVQISTDYVFGRDTGRSTPYRESDPPGPLGVYARSKLEGERHAATWPKHVIVRTCGLYSCRAAGGSAAGGSSDFVDTMLRLAREGKRLRVVDDQHVTPSFVPHVARAVRFLADAGVRGIFHVVNSGETTWHGFAAELFRLSGVEAALEPVSTAEYGAIAPRPLWSVLDTTKYNALSGRPAMPPWQEALAECFSHV